MFSTLSHTWLQLWPGDTEVTSARLLAACPPWKMLALMLLVCLKSQPRIAAMSDREAAQLEKEQQGGEGGEQALAPRGDGQG